MGWISGLGCLLPSRTGGYITAAKALEAELREENARLKGLLEPGGK